MAGWLNPTLTFPECVSRENTESVQPVQINQATKSFLVDEFDLDPNASDEEAIDLLREKVKCGELTLQELLAVPNAMPALKEFADWATEYRGMPDDADVFTLASFAQAATEDGSFKQYLAEKKRAKSTEGTESMPATSSDIAPENKSNTTTGQKMAAGCVRVKAPSERYSTTKSYVKHAKTGEPMFRRGAQVETTSELEYAKLGVFLKMRALKSGMSGFSLSEHERELLGEMIEKDAWISEANESDSGKSLSPSEVKASLLGDTATGGQYATPLFFDDALVTTPLLTGEIAPYVNQIEMNQGTTVQGASMGVPTVAWDQAAEGTAITLNDMTGFVSQMNSSVHRVTAAYKFGRNLLSDTPIALAQEVQTQVSARIAAELDRVVAVGNGSTEPEGLFNCSGSTVVNSVMGPSGPPTVSDLERLMFSVPKQYRTAAWRPCFTSLDYMYARIRGIPNGENDARRVFGMDEGSYTVLDWPYRVQNSITDGYIAFACLAAYRLYRRAGAEIRFSDQGQTLMLANEALITVQGRYAGRMTIGAAMAKITDGPTFDNG